MSELHVLIIYNIFLTGYFCSTLSNHFRYKQRQRSVFIYIPNFRSVYRQPIEIWVKRCFLRKFDTIYTGSNQETQKLSPTAETSVRIYDYAEPCDNIDIQQVFYILQISKFYVNHRISTALGAQNCNIILFMGLTSAVRRRNQKTEFSQEDKLTNTVYIKPTQI